MNPAAPLCSLDRRGVALPLALFTLVIAAVMITAVFYVGRLEQRMGYNSLASTQAFEAAEAGAAAVLTSWVPSTYNSMAAGATISLPSTSVGGNAVYTASVRRLNSVLFLIQAEGRYLIAGQAVTRRQVARLVRLEPPEVLPEGGLITRLGLEVNGTAAISGVDLVPAGWGGFCPSAGPTAPAIVDSSGGVITTGPCTGLVCLTGSPQLQVDPVNVTSATFEQLGTSSFTDLAASAEKIVSGSVSPGPTFDAGPVCRYGDLLNWGSPEDPTGPCGEYFPIIYAPGDLTLSGGTGQGILLVEGHLNIVGGVRFYGVILVRGTLGLDAGNVYGTVMTENQSATPSQVGGTQISFSRCVLDRATTGAAWPRALEERSWVQLY